MEKDSSYILVNKDYRSFIFLWGICIGGIMEKRAFTLPKKLDFLEKNTSFVVFFCSVLLAAAFYMLYLLVATGTTEQNSIFFGGPGSSDTFMDFFNVLKYISGRDPYHYTEVLGLGEKAYPPLVYLILYPFSRLFDYVNNHPIAARSTQFGLMSAVFFIGVCTILSVMLLYHYKVGNGLSKALTVSAIFLSGVFLYAIERGNTVILATVFLTAFIFWYRSPNKVIRELSYLALALAVGIKIYPVIFGILILKEKRWWAAGRTVIYGLLAFFLPFLFFKGGLSNFSQLISNANENTLIYQFLAPIYRLGWLPFYLQNAIDTLAYRNWILLGNITLVLAVIFCLGLKSSWKTITLLTCALIATPINSAYYCGIYLFPAIVLFLNEKKHHVTDWLYVVGFVLILNPYQFVVDYRPMTGQIANTALLIVYILLLMEAMILSALAIQKLVLTRIFSKQKVSLD